MDRCVAISQFGELEELWPTNDRLISDADFESLVATERFGADKPARRAYRRLPAVPERDR